MADDILDSALAKLQKQASINMAQPPIPDSLMQQPAAISVEPAPAPAPSPAELAAVNASIAEAPPVRAPFIPPALRTQANTVDLGGNPLPMEQRPMAPAAPIMSTPEQRLEDSAVVNLAAPVALDGGQSTPLYAPPVGETSGSVNSSQPLPEYADNVPSLPGVNWDESAALWAKGNERPEYYPNAQTMGEGMYNHIQVNGEGGALNPQLMESPADVTPEGIAAMSPEEEAAAAAADYQAQLANRQGGGGAASFSSSVANMKGPDYRGLMQVNDAQAENLAGLRKGVEGNQRGEEANLLEQAQFAGELAGGYAKEKKELERDVQGYRDRVRTATDDYASRLNQGLNPNAIFAPGGVNKTNSMLLAAAMAMKSGNMTAGVEFYDGLVEKDLAHQKNLQAIAGEKADTLIGALERATGDKQVAETLFRANKLDQMSKQAESLAMNTQNQEVAANLRKQALEFKYKNEQLKLKAEQETAAMVMQARRDMEAARVARMKLAAGARNSKPAAALKKEAKEFQKSDGAANQQISNKVAELTADLDDYKDKYGDDYEGGLSSKLPGTKTVVEWGADVFGSERALDRQAIGSVIAELNAVGKKQTYGGDISEAEAAQAGDFLPTNSANLRNALATIKRQADEGTFIQGAITPEMAAIFAKETKQAKPHGTATGE